SSSSISLTNDVMLYTADIGVGSPATYYTVLVDTRSSNTWIGANKAYAKTATSQDTGNAFCVAYGSGNVVGEGYTDTMTLNSDLVIDNQSIGVAFEYSGTNSLNGIHGLEPVNLMQGTVSNTDKVATVMDNLYKQGKISLEVFGVFFAPASSNDHFSQPLERTS
ncbi:aspartic peptidase domain-containing protein, partial [Suillus variegatus]